MLAVVLTTKYRTCAVTIPKYYIYVINGKTGRKVNLDEILEYKNINKDDFNEKVKILKHMKMILIKNFLYMKMEILIYLFL